MLGNLGRGRDKIGVAAHSRQFQGDFLGWQDEIDRAAADGALRHAVVFGRLSILGESDAAGGLDLRQSQRAVRAGTRQDHADRGRLLIFGQRLEELVDRQVQSARLTTGLELQDSRGDGHRRVGGDDVDVVGANGQVLRRLHDGCARRLT